MVAVDDEDWQRNIDVWIHVVELRLLPNANFLEWIPATYTLACAYELETMRQ